MELIENFTDFGFEVINTTPKGQHVQRTSSVRVTNKKEGISIVVENIGSTVSEHKKKIAGINMINWLIDYLVRG